MEVLSSAVQPGAPGARPLACRGASLVVAAQALLLAAVCGLLVALGLSGGLSSFSVFPGSLTNAPEVTGVYGVGLAATLGIGGALVVGLWRGRAWAIGLGGVAEVIWVGAVLVASRGAAYSVGQDAVLLAPSVIALVLLAISVVARRT